MKSNQRQCYRLGSLKLSSIFLKTGLLVLLGTGCGTWAGNPSGDGDEDDSGETPQVIASGGGTIGQQRQTASPGEVFVQKLRLKSGVAFKATPKFKSLNLMQSIGTNISPLEISIVSSEGKEILYQRSSVTETQSTEVTSSSEGEFAILIKNNSSTSTDMESLSIEGATAEGSIELGHKRANAPYQDILLKGVVALARTCKSFNADGSATEEVTAAAGSYFAQPFVFMGKVGADKKVTPITSAFMTLVLGSQEQVLTKISDLPLKALSDYSLPKNADVVRLFYQGYFGAAGELYTTETLLFGGDCKKATQFQLGTDVGVAKFVLQIKDSSLSPALDISYPLRATVAAPFSTYTSSGEKLVDYTQCTLDGVTGKPKTYNGDATTCKTFSFADPPYVQLDYKLPSETTATLTKDSDPNRVLFYGYARPTAWYTKILEQSQALISREVTQISIPGCLNNGGLIAVPLVPKKTPMPLAEFNSIEDDVVNLASRPGTYTSALGFYQGNVDLSGDIRIKACIPQGSSSCGEERDITVTMGKCHIKADSGISVTSISDSFIYPSYFTMSGILKK